MFIIWGKRPTSKILGYTKQLFHCSHCGNDTSFQVVSNKSWFTLYFIPIFPFSIHYRFECSICEYGISIEREKVKEILESEE